MFLEGGHKVYIFDIDDDELQHTTKVHLKSFYDEKKVESAICDLRDVKDIRAKVKEAAKFFDNNIDVLINNGGIASPQWKDGKTMEDPDTFEEWQAYIDTNLTGPFAMSQACIPFMKSRASDAKTGAHQTYGSGPCIIHIGSFRAHQSDPNQEGYASSKAGQLGLMHSMAISLGPLGIRVNLIAPGRIKVAHESKEGRYLVCNNKDVLANERQVMRKAQIGKVRSARRMSMTIRQTAREGPRTLRMQPCISLMLDL
jgi:ribonuclease Z